MNAFKLPRVRALAGCVFAAASLWLGVAPAYAQQSPLAGYEDIDIFANPPSANDLPNVLLILDNSANWSSASAGPACATYADGTAGPPPKEVNARVGIQKCALVNTVLSLQTNMDGSAKFKVGLMLLNPSKNGSGTGAYPRLAFLPMTATNKATLVSYLKALDEGNDKSNNAEFANALWEAYRWYGGLSVYKGQGSPSLYDTTAFNGSNYISPATNSCGRNYIILITNGAPENNAAEKAIRPLMSAAGANTNQIDYVSSYIGNDEDNWSDEMARFLRGIDVSNQNGAQSVITYTIAITSNSPTTNEVKTNNFIKEIAVQGGGVGYSATNVTQLQIALNDIFNQIQAVNSVFASASLPVSVNAQGTFLNQVFMGMFRPDADTKPRWAGNLKQYQFAYNAATQRVDLVDSVGVTAVNPTTGFIQPGATSFWSTASPITDFWKNKTWPGEVNSGGAADAPDGQIVEKGGVAQRLREQFLTSQTGRNVYTPVGGALGAFNTTNVSPDSLGLPSTDTAGRDAIVAWVRGADNKSPSDESGPGTVTGASGTVTVRGSIHGDVIHSSPAVINYGGTTGVVVFYGTNGGMLHAVRGAKTGTGAGQELWSFVPSEFLPRFKRLRDNEPKIQFASTNTTTSPGVQRKNYGMDGPITFYRNVGTGGRTYLYAAMRRGGRALYAFDVTDPASPSLLWKVDNGTVAELGQTWSEPRVTRIDGITDPVIVMGGGYDADEEDKATPGTPTMGNAVVVLNARTGAVLKKFTGLARPVPAAVALVDGNNDSKMDRAYAVDLGGNIYRLTFPDATPANWTITKIADMGAGSTASQKMFYAPAVTPTIQAGQTVWAIQVGTGDREKPLVTSGTANRFYTVYDRGQTDAKVLGDLVEMTSSGISSIPSDKHGCYYTLPNAGEKVVNAVTYTSGYAFFGTNGPAASSALQCTGNLGVARSYAIPALCGPVKVQTLDGGGFPPTAVVGTVLIPPTTTGGQTPVDCDANPAACKRVPVGIGITPPDCSGGASLVKSSIGASNIYACTPAQRLRRDWSVRTPR